MDPRSRLLVLVDAEAQRLRAFRQGREVFSCAVSTAEKGMGCLAGSNRTPWGWHRIARVIGRDAARGERFVSRRRTGEAWTGQAVEEDWILTRILWLEGLEEGVNHGPGVDSFHRYIYIHGTNHEDRLGTPASHGCVRVSNDDAVALARLVRPGDLVHIGPRGPDGPPVDPARSAASGIRPVANPTASPEA